MKDKVSYVVIDIIVILCVALIVLKLFGIVSWPWILSPLIILIIYFIWKKVKK